MALVPWPDDAGERTAAVAVIVAAAGIDESAALRLGPVAAELVQSYAPNAPAIEIKDESAIRVSCYLHTNKSSHVTSLSVGPLDVRYAAQRGSRDPLAISGAAALLAGYRKARMSAVKL